MPLVVVGKPDPCDPELEETMQTSTSWSERVFSAKNIVVALLAFMYFVWPTLYVLIAPDTRVNRLTGKVQRFCPNANQWMSQDEYDKHVFPIDTTKLFQEAVRHGSGPAAIE